MDVKIKEDSNYKFVFIFLLQFYFISIKYFIANIYAKFLFCHLNPRHVFPVSLCLQRSERLTSLTNVWIFSVHHRLVLNLTVNILKLGRIKILMRATSQFHFLIKFHCRFQRHDQQQCISIIANTKLINDGSVNDFQTQ